MKKKQDHSAELPALVDRAKSGDRGAMEALYAQTYPALWRTVRAMTKNDADALDILQESYLRAFTQLGSLRSPEQFLPWLKRIAVNELRRQLRRKHPTLFSELAQESDVPPVEPVEPQTPELLLEQREQADALRALLDALPDGQRTILTLYYFGQYSVREIAEQLGISESTVKSQLHHGRKKLEAALKGESAALSGGLALLLGRRQGTQTPPAQADALRNRALPRAARLTARAAGESGRSALVTRLIAGAMSLSILGGAAYAAARVLDAQKRFGDVQPPETVWVEQRTDPTQPPTEPPTEAPAEAPTEKQTQAPTEVPAELPTEQATQASAEPLPAQTKPLATEPTLTEAPTEPEPALTEATSEQSTGPEVPPTGSPLPPGPGNVYLKQGEFYYTSFTSDYALELFCINDAGERADDCLLVSAYGTTVELIFDAKRPGNYAVYARVPPQEEVWYYFTAIVS